MDQRSTLTKVPYFEKLLIAKIWEGFYVLSAGNWPSTRGERRCRTSFRKYYAERGNG